MSDVKDHSFQKYVIRVERESAVRKRMRERERTRRGANLAATTNCLKKIIYGLVGVAS